MTTEKSPLSHSMMNTGKKSQSLNAVKVLAETDGSTKQVGMFSLYRTAPFEDRGNVVCLKKSGRPNRKLNRNVSQNKPGHGDSSGSVAASSMSSMTVASTVDSCESWTLMAPSVSFDSTISSSEASSDVEWSQRMPSRPCLRITTQDASLRVTFQDSDEGRMEKQNAPSSSLRSFFFDLFFAGCFIPDCCIFDQLEWDAETRACRETGCLQRKQQFAVAFYQVKVHHHIQTLGDHFGVNGGPPLSLGNWIATSVMSVDSFEKERPQKVPRINDLLIPAEERRSILLRSGVSKRRMARYEKASAEEGKRFRRKFSFWDDFKILEKSRK